MNRVRKTYRISYPIGIPGITDGGNGRISLNRGDTITVLDHSTMLVINDIRDEDNRLIKSELMVVKTTQDVDADEIVYELNIKGYAILES